jgi:hypothetical protein
MFRIPNTTATLTTQRFVKLSGISEQPMMDEMCSEIQGSNAVL